MVLASLIWTNITLWLDRSLDCCQRIEIRSCYPLKSQTSRNIRRTGDSLTDRGWLCFQQSINHSGQADSAPQGLSKRMDRRGKHSQATEFQAFKLVGLHNDQQSSSSKVWILDLEQRFDSPYPALLRRRMCMIIPLFGALHMSKSAPTIAGFPVWLQPEGTLTTVTAASVTVLLLNYFLSHCL